VVVLAPFVAVGFRVKRACMSAMASSIRSSAVGMIEDNGGDDGIINYCGVQYYFTQQCICRCTTVLLYSSFMKVCVSIFVYLSSSSKPVH